MLVQAIDGTFIPPHAIASFKQATTTDKSVVFDVLLVTGVMHKVEISGKADKALQTIGKAFQ